MCNPFQDWDATVSVVIRDLRGRVAALGNDVLRCKFLENIFMLENADFSAFGRSKAHLELLEAVWNERIALSKRMASWNACSIAEVQVEGFRESQDVQERLMRGIDAYFIELGDLHVG